MPCVGQRPWIRPCSILQPFENSRASTQSAAAPLAGRSAACRSSCESDRDTCLHLVKFQVRSGGRTPLYPWQTEIRAQTVSGIHTRTGKRIPIRRKKPCAPCEFATTGEQVASLHALPTQGDQALPLSKMGIASCHGQLMLPSHGGDPNAIPRDRHAGARQLPRESPRRARRASAHATRPRQ